MWDHLTVDFAFFFFSLQGMLNFNYRDRRYPLNDDNKNFSSASDQKFMKITNLPKLIWLIYKAPTISS